MEESEFVESGRPAWERLASSVRDARARGIATLPAAALRRMHEDYRRTAADLAYAQTHFPGTATERSLNALVGQAHGELYGASPRRLAAVLEFFARGWPRLVRSNRRPLLLAAALFAGAMVMGWALAYVDYPLARMFLPEQLRDSVADSFRQASPARQAMASLAPVLSAFIAVNNAQVAMVAFAGGMTLGLVTVYALIMNGALLGVLGAVFTQAGIPLDFWSLVVPHGSVELPAIVLAAGAGLMLARALVLPGDLPRLAALRDAAGPATRIVLGTLPLFAVAALVEGFITPRGFDPALKLAIGGVLFVALALYVTLPGRRGEG